MLVKLIEGKFEVTAFVAEHNHDLINKSSLTKYLHSHQGILREERNFLTTLHHCNLETGRMMSVMSKFYGCAKLVPYTTKKLSNLRTNIRTLEIKEGVMAATLSYFHEKQKADPRFYFWMKLDSDERVENLF